MRKKGPTTKHGMTKKEKFYVQHLCACYENMNDV